MKTSWKKVVQGLCIALCILILANTVAFADTTAAQTVQYPDIVGHKFEAQIRQWIEKGYIKGNPDGSFKPGNPITRAEFAALTNRAFGFNESIDINYTDIKTGDWYSNDASKATKSGYMKGSNGKFMPLDNISRQELAMIVSRLAKTEETAVDDSQLKSLKDGGSIPAWSKAAVSTALKNGFFEGFVVDLFKPEEKITRAEAVVVLDRALKQGKEPLLSEKNQKTVINTILSAADADFNEAGIQLKVSGMSVGYNFDALLKPGTAPASNLYGVLVDQKGKVWSDSLTFYKFYEDSFYGTSYFTGYEGVLDIGKYKMLLYSDAAKTKKVMVGYADVVPMIHDTTVRANGVDANPLTMTGFISNFDKSGQNDLRAYIRGKEIPISIQEDGTFSYSVELAEGDNTINLKYSYNSPRGTGSSSREMLVSYYSNSEAQLTLKVCDYSTGGYKEHLLVNSTQDLDLQVISPKGKTDFDKKMAIKVTMLDTARLGDMKLNSYNGTTRSFEPLVLNENGEAWYHPYSSILFDKVTYHFQASFSKPGNYAYKIEFVELGANKVLGTAIGSLKVGIIMGTISTKTGHKFSIDKKLNGIQADKIYGALYDMKGNCMEQSLIFQPETSTLPNNVIIKLPEMEQVVTAMYNRTLAAGQYEIRLYQDTEHKEPIVNAYCFVRPGLQITTSMWRTVNTEKYTVTGFISSYDPNQTNEVSYTLNNGASMPVTINGDGTFLFEVTLALGENKLSVDYNLLYSGTGERGKALNTTIQYDPNSTLPNYKIQDLKSW